MTIGEDMGYQLGGICLLGRAGLQAGSPELLA